MEILGAMVPKINSTLHGACHNAIVYKLEKDVHAAAARALFAL
jgi:hypothetical protein